MACAACCILETSKQFPWRTEELRNWRNNALNRYFIICCAQIKCSNIVVFLIIFLTLIELRRWKKKKIWKLQVTAYCSTRNKTRVKLYYLFLLRIITRCRNTRCIIIKVFSRYANICLSLCLQCALLCISFLRESTPRWPWIFLISLLRTCHGELQITIYENDRRRRGYVVAPNDKMSATGWTQPGCIDRHQSPPAISLQFFLHPYRNFIFTLLPFPRLIFI